MQARLAPLGKRVIAVQAGSSLTHRWFRRQPNLKGLAPQQWGRWLARLMERGHADAVVLLGSRQERREAEAILHATPAAWRNRVHDVTGEVSLGDLPAYLAACHAVLSVDTGPGHIAAAVGTPLLSIFGPTNPDIFAPRGAGRIHVLTGSAPCQFCHWKPEWKTCRANVCLTGLSDDALDNAYVRLFA
jgi:ADP-heptose:LPS heptosyltransferase